MYSLDASRVVSFAVHSCIFPPLAGVWYYEIFSQFPLSSWAAF